MYVLGGTASSPDEGAVRFDLLDAPSPLAHRVPCFIVEVCAVLQHDFILQIVSGTTALQLLQARLPGTRYSTSRPCRVPVRVAPPPISYSHAYTLLSCSDYILPTGALFYSSTGNRFFAENVVLVHKSARKKKNRVHLLVQCCCTLIRGNS